MQGIRGWGLFQPNASPLPSAYPSHTSICSGSRIHIGRSIKNRNDEKGVVRPDLEHGACRPKLSLVQAALSILDLVCRNLALADSIEGQKASDYPVLE